MNRSPVVVRPGVVRPGVVRIVTLMVIACVLALALGACGKKGSVEPPPGKQTEFPRQYPRR